MKVIASSGRTRYTSSGPSSTRMARTAISKVAGIENFPQTNNVTELKRFLGMVNYLAKYVPELSTVGQLLNELLKRDVE